MNRKQIFALIVGLKTLRSRSKKVCCLLLTLGSSLFSFFLTSVQPLILWTKIFSSHVWEAVLASVMWCLMPHVPVLLLLVEFHRGLFWVHFYLWSTCCTLDKFCADIAWMFFATRTMHNSTSLVMALILGFVWPTMIIRPNTFSKTKIIVVTHSLPSTVDVSFNLGFVPKNVCKPRGNLG